MADEMTYGPSHPGGIFSPYLHPFNTIAAEMEYQRRLQMAQRGQWPWEGLGASIPMLRRFLAERNMANAGAPLPYQALVDALLMRQQQIPSLLQERFSPAEVYQRGIRP